ncbi:hypothetical protein [Flavobacterium sp.]|uniref:hypothetical protein n=1 Tax=Flavobacterium sp. TaxID=239 RepID=UPI00374D6473
MKKLIYLLSAILLVLTSCTDDYAVINQKGVIVVPETPLVPDVPVVTDSTVVVESNLLKKIVHTYKNGFTTTIDFVYDGNKIVSETDQDGFKINYTYTGDLITKVEKLYANGEVYISKQYIYEDGRLKDILRQEFGSYFKVNYKYNSNNTIWFAESNSNSEGIELEATGRTGTYTILDGNLIKSEKYLGSSQSVTTFEYDSEKNPKYNVVGFNLLLDVAYEQSINNPVNKNDVSGLSTASWTYKYEYNTNGYPTLNIGKSAIDGSPFIETTQFFY